MSSGTFERYQSTLAEFLNQLDNAGVVVNNVPEISETSDTMKLGPKLGQGGFASVYELTDRDGNQYAGKCFDLHVADLKSLFKEIHGMKRMEGVRNVVQLISVYITSFDVLYIVMEYMKDGTLRDFLTKHPGLSKNVKRHIMRMVAQGLLGIHTNGLIHRDIKNGNILIRVEDGTITAKIADFGLCWDPSISGVCDSFAGTSFYVSPEASRSRDQSYEWRCYDTPTDIWSLAILIARIHGLTLPHFHYKEKRDVLWKLETYTQREIPLFNESPKISAECCDVVNRCLQVDPSERLTIEEVINLPYFKVDPEP
ncbi:MAG: serine/threonine-protein kinase [Euryarchaeota archaeon]|nr:serine/threonine-protein kinase [Euryarchaeota archaeon]